MCTKMRCCQFRTTSSLVVTALPGWRDEPRREIGKGGVRFTPYIWKSPCNFHKLHQKQSSVVDLSEKFNKGRLQFAATFHSAELGLKAVADHFSSPFSPIHYRFLFLLVKWKVLFYLLVYFNFKTLESLMTLLL